MSVKNILITGSIGSTPSQSYGQKLYVSSQDDESIPMETFIGGDGGTFPDSSSIAQSWTSSINSPVGIITTIHNTEDEFYNGELDGTTITVSTQSLNPNNYLLEANTVDINYKIYFYKYSETSDNFLNTLTSPNNGELFLFYVDFPLTVPGVTYAKIAKIDNDGNTNILSLQELDNIRVKFNDIGLVNYVITSITEYNNYYLYTISHNNSISTTDNNKLNYQLSASTYLTSSLPILGGLVAALTNYSENTDAQNYFDPTAGTYTFGDTPNIQIYFTASATFTPDSTGSITLAISTDLANKFGSIIQSTITASNTSVNIILTGSLSPIDGTYYFLDAFSLSGVGITASNVTWKITQSASPNSVISPTILEPYLSSTFRNSDFDVLMNNVTELESTPNFMRVLYNDGYVIPSNQQKILSGSAEDSNVKLYNYRLSSQILPRYNGVKLTGQKLNQYNNGDVSFGNTPVIESLGTYFVYFDSMDGTNYELIDKKAAHILYLIDKDGNISTPTSAVPYYPNLIQNFVSGENANIVFLSSTGNAANIQGIKEVIKAGVYPKPIVYSQSGSTANSSSVILFDNIYSLLNVPDYRTSVAYNTFTITSLGFNILDNTTVSEILGSTNTTSNLLISTDRNIEITTTTSNTQGIISININNIETIGALSQTPITIQLIQKLSGGTWQSIANIPKVIYFYPTSFSVSTGPLPLNNGDQYRVVIQNPNNETIRMQNGTFVLSQNPSPSNIGCYPPYWTTGSTPGLSNVLTGSTFTGSYDINSPLYQTFPSSSDYSSPLPFTLKISDEIRFGGDEAQTYRITAVEGTEVSGSLFLTLDRPIPSLGTNLDCFFIRRFEKDPNYIILNIPALGGGSGFIFPEYTTLEIQQNFDKIVTKLKEKQLIP